MRWQYSLLEVYCDCGLRQPYLDMQISWIDFVSLLVYLFKYKESQIRQMSGTNNYTPFFR